MLLGLPAAYLFSHYEFPGKSLLRIAVTLPFILPTVVVAAGFNALIGPRGWANLILMEIFSLNEAPIHLLNSLYAILLAHIFYNTSVVIRVVSAAWQQLDLRLEQAGRVLGASQWQNFWKVVFPLLLPSILSAILLVFLFDFTSFGVIMLLGGPRFATIEVEIYIQTMHMLNFPLASLLSVLQLLFTFLITALSIKLGGASMAPFMPRLRGERVKRLSSDGSKIFAMCMIFLLVLILVLPVVALGLRSVTQLEAVRGGRGSFTSGLTLDFYREIFINRRQSLFYVPPITAVRNSMIYALSASVLSDFLGMLAALALTRTQRKSIWLDSLLMLPLGTSAVTMGFGFIIAFSQLSNALYYYPLLIPIVHTLVSLPFVVRVLQPALAAIPQSLRQAAKALGASPFQVWRNIDLPIIGRAVAVSAIFSFTISLGEFGATSFLTRPDIPTIPIAIFRYLNLPGALNYGQAMVMATILLIVCGLSMWLMESLLVNVSE